MDHKDSHPVKNLDFGRVNVPIQHRAGIRTRDCRQLELDVSNYYNDKKAVYLRTLHILSFLMRLTSFGS